MQKQFTEQQDIVERATKQGAAAASCFLYLWRRAALMEAGGVLAFGHVLRFPLQRNGKILFRNILLVCARRQLMMIYVRV